MELSICFLQQSETNHFCWKGVGKYQETSVRRLWSRVVHGPSIAVQARRKGLCELLHAEARRPQRLRASVGRLPLGRRFRGQWFGEYHFAAHAEGYQRKHVQRLLVPKIC